MFLTEYLFWSKFQNLLKSCITLGLLMGPNWLKWWCENFWFMDNENMTLNRVWSVRFTVQLFSYRAWTRLGSTWHGPRHHNFLISTVAIKASPSQRRNGSKLSRPSLKRTLSKIPPSVYITCPIVLSLMHVNDPTTICILCISWKMHACGHTRTYMWSSHTWSMYA